MRLVPGPREISTVPQRFGSQGSMICNEIRRIWKTFLIVSVKKFSCCCFCFCFFFLIIFFNLPQLVHNYSSDNFNVAMLSVINALSSRCTLSRATVWRHTFGSTLTHVMVCRLTAPSHYLNQCGIIIKFLPGIHQKAISKVLFVNKIRNICSDIALLKLEQLERLRSEDTPAAS